MRKVILMTYLLIFCLILGIGFSEEIKLLSKKELFDIYSNKLKELKLPTVNVNNIKFDEFRVVYNTNEDGVNIPLVSCKNANFGMDIDPISGRVMGCDNSYISDKVSGPNSPLFKGGAKPTRDKDSIIKEAERYFRILYDDTLKDAVLGNASYSVGRWPKEGYSSEGEWVVSWRRKAGGYFYYHDCIGMGINEKYGLSGLTYRFISVYHPLKQINITKEKSIEIAKQNIKRIMRARVFGNWYDRFKAGELNSAELMIVNPNYTHISKTFIPYEKSKNARLAWVVRFNCITKKENHSTLRPPIEVWIDAETGEVLGGG